MTNVITFITTNFVTLFTEVVLSDWVAVSVSVLLLILLIEKVLVDAYEGKPIESKTNRFMIVVVPLLFVMAIIVLFRLAQILSLR
jgi:hypothetical protein